MPIPAWKRREAGRRANEAQRAVKLERRFYVALREAFDVAVRQIDEHARVLRGEIKVHATR